MTLRIWDPALPSNSVITLIKAFILLNITTLSISKIITLSLSSINSIGYLSPTLPKITRTYIIPNFKPRMKASTPCLTSHQGPLIMANFTLHTHTNMSTQLHNQFPSQQTKFLVHKLHSQGTPPQVHNTGIQLHIFSLIQTTRITQCGKPHQQIKYLGGDCCRAQQQVSEVLHTDLRHQHLSRRSGTRPLLQCENSHQALGMTIHPTHMIQLEPMSLTVATPAGALVP